MSPGDFGLSVFASWLANKLDTFLKTPVSEGATHTTVQSAAIPAEEQRSEGPEIKRTARFRTFDSARDFDTLLRTVSEPVISILIEDTPSTSYRLPSMVLESRVTGEWFVFPRMRMSFEGNGGGLRNARDTFDLIRLVGANVGAWVVPQQVLDSLDNGYLVWAEVQPTAIPLLAVISGEHSWSEIERNVQRFLAPPTPEE